MEITCGKFGKGLEWAESGHCRRGLSSRKERPVVGGSVFAAVAGVFGESSEQSGIHSGLPKDQGVATEWYLRVRRYVFLPTR